MIETQLIEIQELIKKTLCASAVSDTCSLLLSEKKTGKEKSLKQKQTRVLPSRQSI